MEPEQTLNTPLKLALGILPAAWLMMGCQSHSVYYWGHYQQVVYATYSDPGKTPAELQVRMMVEDKQKAASAHKPLPPGFHAQLGYLYYRLGKPDAASQEFVAEKTQFPESTVLMDRLLANLSKQ